MLKDGVRVALKKGSQGEALAPQPSPTFKHLAIVEVEIRDALWQVLDIP